MGTWGAGNFQNDSALDHVGEFVDEIVAHIVQSTDAILADEDRRALDEEGNGVVMPDMEILSVLVEHCHAEPPRPEVITGWQEQFMTVFDDQIGDLSLSQEYTLKRRAVIQGTFQKLFEQAENYWRNYDEAAVGMEE